MSEAMGKILGMLMAYGVSSLGLFLAYANYRRRTIGADRIMTGRAWIVILVVLAAVGAGVGVVSELAEMPARSGEAGEQPASAEASPVAVAEPSPTVAPASDERPQWPLVGILVPAAIFLFATWVTSALHRHFTTHGHSGNVTAGETNGT